MTRLLTAVLLTAALIVGCDSNRVEKTERIQSLSQAELAEIYARLDELKRKDEPMNLRGEQIPPVVARLKPVSVMIRGDSAWIHISGAVDDKVYVFVNGLGESQGDKEIVLSPGEGQSQQVLWRQPR